MCVFNGLLASGSVLITFLVLNVLNVKKSSGEFFIFSFFENYFFRFIWLVLISDYHGLTTVVVGSTVFIFLGLILVVKPTALAEPHI